VRNMYRVLGLATIGLAALLNPAYAGVGGAPSSSLRLQMPAWQVPLPFPGRRFRVASS
jgi:hypothetical protein